MVGEENEGKSSKKMENFSLEINRYPRDLLQRLSSLDAQQLRANRASEGEEEEDEIELNLGLSLGGRFGVEKSSGNLKRSSSIAGTIPLVRNHEAVKTTPVSHPVLTRTSSLPVETEEEWRKRKEIQSLRRMSAKRRRNEKQKNLNLNLEEGKRGVDISKGNLVPNWIRQGNRGNTLQVWVGQQQGSQGSLESQGGSSSGLTEIENNLPPQGSNSGGKTRSSMSSQSLQGRGDQETAGSSGTRGHEITSITSRSSMDNSSKKDDKVENMPCVFTIGEGPKGRRVEGILYKYGKGEEVRIMCVCHGSFLTPAEFVKHAGGVDVDHPLRHIVVNTSGGSFL